MQKGKLPWRVVSHGRRWAYEVLVPDNASPCGGATAALSMEAYLRRQVEAKEREVARLKRDVQRQEQQIENLAQALARARAGSDNSPSPDSSPYSKYRELVIRRRRWWLF